MKRLGSLASVLCVVSVFAVSGCSDDEPTQPTGYLDQSSPEAVVTTLTESWLRKDAEVYGKLLRHDYRFEFQEVDQIDIGFEFLTLEQDLAATKGLFTASDIGDITLMFVHGDAVPSTDPGFPDAMHIRVNPAGLEVLRLPDTTLLVAGDIQDLFLAKGIAEEGENPELWYLVEWRDIPGPRRAGELPGAAVEQPTIGGIKALNLPR